LDEADQSNFIATVHANMQKVGVYFTPFVYWGTAAEGSNNTMYGSSYYYSQAFLRTSNGAVQTLDGGIALDPTHPGTTNLINAYIDNYKADGFDFVKMDFLSHASLEGQHFAPNVTTGIQGYNYGMAEIRARVGGALFISESIAPIFPAEYGHSRRIACDAFGTTSSTEYELNSLTYGWWQNKRIYKHIDMDSMDLLTNNLEVARTVVNATAISGGLILDGNNLMNGNQLNLATSLLLNSSINGIARMGKAFRAVDGNTGTNASTAFALTENGTNYVALFNYSSSTANVSVSLSRAGLSGTQNYAVKDLWTGATNSATGTLSVSLTSGQSKVYQLQ
jgi:alpha-galactosidase